METSDPHPPSIEDLLLQFQEHEFYWGDVGGLCEDREKKQSGQGRCCGGLLHTLETVSFQGPCPSWSRRTVSSSSSIRTESCRFISRSISLSTFLSSFCR